MKKFFLSALAAGFCLMACNNAKTDTGSEKNLEAARKIAGAFQSGDANSIDNYVADDFVDHSDQGDKKGKDSLKAMINMVHNNFKDMKTETLSETADKDYVFQWMKYEGTSDGSMGMPAGPFTLHVMEVSRFKDGKAVEHWAYMESGEMMKMMQASMPHTEMQQHMDTSMKK